MRDKFLIYLLLFFLMWWINSYISRHTTNRNLSYLFTHNVNWISRNNLFGNLSHLFGQISSEKKPFKQIHIAEDSQSVMVLVHQDKKYASYHVCISVALLWLASKHSFKLKLANKRSHSKSNLQVDNDVEQVVLPFICFFQLSQMNNRSPKVCSQHYNR